MTLRTALVLLMMLVAMTAFAQPIPAPTDLSATLDPTSGDVALSWVYDTDPGGGYSTDFDTDDLTGWELDDPSRWTLDPDNSVLGTAWTPAGDWWWSVASYTAATYDAAELTATLRRTGGQENWAQSMFICGAGVFEPPAWTGFMVQIEVSATPQYNVTRVYEGSTSFVTNGWNDTPYINTGLGAWNTMTVQTSGTGLYTLIINGEAVFDWQDDQIMGGMVSIGGVGEPGVPQAIEWDAVSFQPMDVATAVYGTAPVGSSGTTPLVIGGADPRGAHMAWDGAEVLPGNGTVVSELDDFLEFEIYRNGNLVGTTSDLSFTDTLPEPQDYSYMVVAAWDEGDSDPSPAAPVTWLPLTLLPGVVDVPAGGGDVTYDVTATVMYPNPLPNLTWATSVTTPAGTQVPVSSLMVNLPPNYQGTLTGQTLSVPAWAPPGTYTFTGTLGYPGSVTVSDSFEFTKQGAATGQAFQPGQSWPQE